jgi:hypothetical protein
LSDEHEVTRVTNGWIVMKGDKKIGGPFNSWRAALEWIDSQKPKHQRAAPDIDGNTPDNRGYGCGVISLALVIASAISSCAASASSLRSYMKATKGRP